ncbi:hypothetical protein GE061_000374 [Apolygus lucorum]|uniref:Uncharacterized protein n=1 Tax=Apolygus lucorum TaxID=248454 RepID=A0A6A4KHT8_APOLU|nr:hypothetical protein GE061_000374 [Apolygus lucorum]
MRFPFYFTIDSQVRCTDGRKVRMFDLPFTIQTPHSSISSRSSLIHHSCEHWLMIFVKGMSKNGSEHH